MPAGALTGALIGATHMPRGTSGWTQARRGVTGYAGPSNTTSHGSQRPAGSSPGQHRPSSSNHSHALASAASLEAHRVRRAGQLAPSQEGQSQARLVRRAACAGSWYPLEAEELSRDVEELLSRSTIVDHDLPLRALVAPHAGLRYSGATAASAYRQVAGQTYQRVVILAPNHRVALRGAAVDASTHYATPLGEMPVDVRMAEELAAHGIMRRVTEPFVREHAIEMQLPFLQRLMPAALLVPILVGELRSTDARTLAEILTPWLDDNSLLVVSSDFTHYGDAFGYRPFRTDIENNLKILDHRALSALTARSAESFDLLLDETGVTICGRNPLRVLLQLCKDDWRAQVLAYTTSGALTGDWEHSVSYASLAFHAPATSRPLHLSSSERRRLLQLARASIAAPEQARLDPDSFLQDTDLTPALRTPTGVFVSLHEKNSGRLRGCMGCLEPLEELARAVIVNAAAAAQQDPRFIAVRASEVAGLDIELSILGLLEKVTDESAIRVGQHGVAVSQAGKRGVLLPQVAAHMNWDRETFLDNVCRKAGLPADAWRRGATLYRFAAEVFSE